MAEKNEPSIGKFGIGIVTVAATSVFGWALLSAIKQPGDAAKAAADISTSVRGRADRIESDIGRIEGEIFSIREQLARTEKTVQRFRESLSYGARFSREDYQDAKETDKIEKEGLQRQIDNGKQERIRLENRIDALVKYLGEENRRQQDARK